MIEKLKRFVQRFMYVPEKKDSYRLLLDEDGLLMGDCDDFALTASYIMSGEKKWKMWWNLITFQHVIWSCKSHTSGNRHAVLWVRGEGWIDNIYPYFRDKSIHKKVVPMLWTGILLKRGNP